MLCLVCSEREATTKGRCDTCARYFRRHGCDRPVHLTARPCAADSVMRLLMRPGDVPIVTLEDLARRPEWQQRAACNGEPIETFFPLRGVRPTRAQALCEHCAARAECLDFAMSDPDLEGTWGGTTTRERQGMRRAAS